MGLIQRTPHPTDGRQVILSATEIGRQVFAENRRARDEWLTTRVASLSGDDREALHRASEILIAWLATDRHATDRRPRRQAPPNTTTHHGTTKDGKGAQTQVRAR